MFPVVNSFHRNGTLLPFDFKPMASYLPERRMGLYYESRARNCRGQRSKGGMLPFVMESIARCPQPAILISRSLQKSLTQSSQRSIRRQYIEHRFS